MWVYRFQRYTHIAIQKLFSLTIKEQTTPFEGSFFPHLPLKDRLTQS
jgi:hypothetical protein